MATKGFKLSAGDQRLCEFVSKHIATVDAHMNAQMLESILSIHFILSNIVLVPVQAHKIAHQIIFFVLIQNAFLFLFIQLRKKRQVLIQTQNMHTCNRFYPREKKIVSKENENKNS